MSGPHTRRIRMSYQVNLKPLSPFSRGVSIIGIGATPFMLTKEDPELDGIWDGEMFGYAAIEAMKDAGITAKDVDFYVHSQAGPYWMSHAETPNIHVANWFGMKGKPSMHHSEACCTGYIALELAAAYVASGLSNMIITGAADMCWSISCKDKPSFYRDIGTDAMFHDTMNRILTKDYTRWSYPMSMLAEGWLDQYIRENGLSDKQIDDVLCTMAKNSRRASALNPMGLSRDTYDDIAQGMGMKDADTFLHSKFNPKLGKYLRISNFELRCDGAAALVVCPTEIARRYTDHPIEVLGFGHSCLNALTPTLEKHATEAAYKQVKDLTGLTGADMDLFMTNDFMMSSQLLSAEACEYLPKGEGWKYFLEDRTNFDGDRPINTNGGRCQYGHASGASGLHDFYETIKQMRGQMGQTQVKKPVKHAMLRGYGGGQNLTCTILKHN